MLLRPISAVLAGFFLAACAPDPFLVEPLSVPVTGPASGPRIAGDAANGFVLSWMTSDEDGSDVHFSAFRNGGWSPARTVVEDRELFVNWADMPMVKPMGNGHLVAHWLQVSGEATYAYDVVFTQSFDDGESWSDPLLPHDDGTQTEHGFVSMFASDQGTGLVWLDGRKFANEVTDDPLDTSMTLRAAFIDNDDAISGEQLIDDIICDCCQTDVAVAASGPIAVFRDRTVDEIRDISVTRYIDGTWQTPVPVADDNWKIPGCPVNGPAIVADGEFVAVAWFTAADDQPEIKLAISQDSGATFAAPIEVASGALRGHVDLVHLGANNVALSWVRRSESDGNELVVVKVAANGSVAAAQTVASTVTLRSVPQMALIGERLVFVWTGTEDSVNRVHSASAPAGAL